MDLTPILLGVAIVLALYLAVGWLGVSIEDIFEDLW